MSYSVRHQVFVSSTFTDLVEERSEVIQAIWEMDCIPTGMEAFVASNQNQWDVIKRVIDECDYYVLIVGGRYGTVTSEGVSYTEKEYRYAQEIAIPVIAFVHAHPEQIALGKSEIDEAARIKLASFRSEIMTKFPVRSWSSASELGGLVSRSLIREIKVSPRPGWIRNDGSSPIALLEQINNLTKENALLRDDLEERGDESDIDPSLEQGSDTILLRGRWTLKSENSSPVYEEEWTARASWNDIYKDIGPLLINEAAEPDLREALSRFSGWTDTAEGCWGDDPITVIPECWNEVLIQLRALGLIAPGIKKRGVNDKSSYWRITPRGDLYLLSLLARKRVSFSSTDL